MSLSSPGPEALLQGPRALALQGLGAGEPSHILFQILDLPCVLAGVLSYVQQACLMYRSLVLCAGVTSYVQGQSLMCRGLILGEVAKPYVKWQSLM